jgi:hypothetical protein
MEEKGRRVFPSLPFSRTGSQGWVDFFTSLIQDVLLSNHMQGRITLSDTRQDVTPVFDSE